MKNHLIRIREEQDYSPILESTKKVVDQALHVKINKPKIIEFCNNFNRNNIKHWWAEAPFSLDELNEKDRLFFLLAFNSISFSYWGEPKWTIEFRGKHFDGAWGMIAALKRGVGEGTLKLNSDFLRRIKKEQLAHILRGNIEIPLLSERYKIIKEIGMQLNSTYRGQFYNLVKEGNKDAIVLLGLIIDTFPSFKDIELYYDKEVLFYKRAQLLVADIYQAFNGKGYGNLKNISKLTACADYKLPQVLRKEGILRYSRELDKKISKKIPLDPGCTEEIEIRSCTIWAVKYIERLLEPKYPYIDSIHINDHLWLKSQNKGNYPNPYHRVRTTAY